MKKILNFLMVMLLVMGLGMASVMTAFQAEAAETAETAGETVSAAETVLTANQDGEAVADASMSASGIYDAADLLSADEEASLLTKLEKYSERYSADIAIVTTDDAGGLSAQAYADAYAEKIGQSMSRDEYPGILFLIDMDNRQIYMATQGQLRWGCQRSNQRSPKTLLFVFRRFACRPAAFLSVCGGQPEREAITWFPSSRTFCKTNKKCSAEFVSKTQQSILLIIGLESNLQATCPF